MIFPVDLSNATESHCPSETEFRVLCLQSIIAARERCWDHLEAITAGAERRSVAAERVARYCEREMRRMRSDVAEAFRCAKSVEYRAEQRSVRLEQRVTTAVTMGVLYAGVLSLVAFVALFRTSM